MPHDRHMARILISSNPIPAGIDGAMPSFADGRVRGFPQAIVLP